VSQKTDVPDVPASVWTEEYALTIMVYTSARAVFPTLANGVKIVSSRLSCAPYIRIKEKKKERTMLLFNMQLKIWLNQLSLSHKSNKNEKERETKTDEFKG